MFIDITGVDKKKLVNAVYDLSSPVGLGFLHFNPAPLSDEEAEAIADGAHGVRMDYVNGRCCKFKTYEVKGKTYIQDRWYDHYADDLSALLARVGMQNAPRVETLPE